MKLKKSPSPVQEYSEGFKRQVVSEYERGLFTKSQLQTRYNIRGNSCISSWLVKYGNFTYSKQLSKGRPMKDPQKQKIKELEAALAKKEEELKVFRKFIEIAERELKIEIGKKVWFQSIPEIRPYTTLSTEDICRLFGYSKQAYYKRTKQFNSGNNQERIIELVLSIRKKMPRLGTRKLYALLKSDFNKENIHIGRDQLFKILRSNYLLIPRRHSYFKTTNSRHWMKKYPNIIKEKEPEFSEKIWVADITYLKTKERNYYLHLITDAYSKKIVGYELSDNLQTSSTLKALKQAIKSRIYKHPLIHHSDRGLQYCSKEYIEVLKKNDILISMTENSDPYENAVAERVNGILKYEFGLIDTFENFKNLSQQIDQSIYYYNNLRPHFSLNYNIPSQVHINNNVKLKTYKKQNQNRKILL
ncbi:IS3-like element ISElsp1 family transposase [Elizabethkingia ursingii]|uniref:IS3-like element ISElsp1 family transposase n=1 Tax=Elizabethkingia ursingii TaxID=1756150 RepID=UPI000D528A3F|nr:IS3-like element ISElsp1 family transposase [Elizabethkingia ursingii]